MQPTCDLYDHFLDTAGVLPPGLQHFGGRRAFSGPAVTVKTHEVNTRVRELAHSPGEGRVMVVDGGGSLRRALMGDVLAAKAAENGWAGAIFYGAVRDVDLLAQTGLGIMALGRTPRKCIRAGEGEVGLVLEIEGVRVATGDLIVADADGALVIPQGLPLPG
ncbi:ribonuclease E activity regulator RraA [Roseicyclus persicicus]|uniref:4-hydroxy-4-methyl-2-oxoglutarate aldolase n=1 Tax=Roseicyclus persicicus TaxID=2650661 RepID=A0A7X6JYW3_9RHOB|nr:ribonuclease E activity regulator RraA [Roseibacterium persicicum]NKX44530.1 ribonuclease E activity regulator RraA [Roseibacterium persicicum]